MTDYTHIEEQIAALREFEFATHQGPYIPDELQEAADTMTDMLAVVRAAKDGLAPHPLTPESRKLACALAKLEQQ